MDVAMSRSGLAAVVDQLARVIPDSAQVRIGVEAAGHYHRPVRDYAWPAGWQVVELNPAHVAEQRRVMGRRQVKTDAIDLEAITELVLAGRGQPVLAVSAVVGQIGAWAVHRNRRVMVRAATKNQLLGQLDRAFPGLSAALPDVLGTKIGRLIAAERPIEYSPTRPPRRTPTARNSTNSCGSSATGHHGRALHTGARATSATFERSCGT
jgi:transposase